MERRISLIVLFLILMPLISAAEYCDETMPVDWTIGNPSVSPSEVGYGGTMFVTIPITNNAQNTLYSCYMDDGNKIDTKDIGPQNTIEFTIEVTAPTEEVASQKTKTINLDIVCEGVWDRGFLYCDYQVYGETTKVATYKYPLQVDIEEQKASDEAWSAANVVEGMADEVISLIDSAKRKIEEASKMGVSSVSSATQYFNQAESSLSNAISLFESGDEADDYGDYSSAISFFEQSKLKLESAQTNALKAKNEAEKLIDEYKQKVAEAQLKAKEEAENKITAEAIKEAEKECEGGEVKYYDCKNDMKVVWCECVNNKWMCVDSPGSQCEEECSGCLNEETCYKTGQRVEIKGEKKYCHFSGTLEGQKNAWRECNENYECQSNLCLEGECTDVKGAYETASKWGNLLSSIACRLSSLFRIEKYDICMLDKAGVNVYEED